ncbi:MAG TPA: DUF4157 domain-containing protein [Acidimicrobiales bacterium]
MTPGPLLIKPMSTTVALQFSEDLASWRAPELALEPLGHLVTPESPVGRVAGLLRPVSGPGLDDAAYAAVQFELAGHAEPEPYTETVYLGGQPGVGGMQMVAPANGSAGRGAALRPLLQAQAVQNLHQRQLVGRPLDQRFNVASGVAPEPVAASAVAPPRGAPASMTPLRPEASPPAAFSPQGRDLPEMERGLVGQTGTLDSRSAVIESSLVVPGERDATSGPANGGRPQLVLGPAGVLPRAVEEASGSEPPPDGATDPGRSVERTTGLVGTRPVERTPQMPTGGPSEQAGSPVPLPEETLGSERTSVHANGLVSTRPVSRSAQMRNAQVAPETEVSVLPPAGAIGPGRTIERTTGLVGTLPVGRSAQVRPGPDTEEMESEGYVAPDRERPLAPPPARSGTPAQMGEVGRVADTDLPVPPAPPGRFGVRRGRRVGLGAPLSRLPETAVTPPEVIKHYQVADAAEADAVPVRQGADLPLGQPDRAAQTVKVQALDMVSSPQRQQLEVPLSAPGVIRPLVSWTGPLADRPAAAADRTSTPVTASRRAEMVTRQKVSERTGVDVSSVPVFRSSHSATQSDAMGAVAYTNGAGVHIPPSVGPFTHGQARSVLAHELTHAAQRIVHGNDVPDEASPLGRRFESEATMAERTFTAGLPPSSLDDRPLRNAPGTPSGSIEDRGTAADAARPLAVGSGVAPGALSRDVLKSLETMVSERHSATSQASGSRSTTGGLPWSAADVAAMHRSSPSVQPARPTQAPARATTPIAGAGSVQRKEAPGKSTPDDAEIERLVNRMFPLISYRLRSELRRENARSGSLTGMY